MPNILNTVAAGEGVPGSDLFLDRGILGAVALLSILAAIYLFRLLTKERKEYLTSLENKTKDYLASLEAKAKESDDRLSELSERIIAEAQAQHEEDRELLTKLTNVLESVSNRVDTRKGR